MTNPDIEYSCNWCSDAGCESCPQPKYSLQPYGSKNPKVIIVLPYPDLDEVNHTKYLTGEKRKLIRVALQNQFYDCYVTSIVKSVELIDPIARVGIRKPSLTSFNFAFASLKLELLQYPDAVIIPIGADATKLFGIDGKFKDVVGKEHIWNSNISGKHFRVIPNYDPYYVTLKPRLMSEFKLNFHKAFSPPIEEKKPEFKTLNFEEACFEIKRAYRLYREGKIDYIIFDTETTSFDAWDGELIMYSWAHEASEVGYAFPLVVNNEIKFKKEKFIEFSECVKELETAIATDLVTKGLTTECLDTVKRDELKTWSTERKRERTANRKLVKAVQDNWTDKIYQREKEKITTDLEVTPLQAGKFNNLLGHVLTEVPIVGHNLKFDAKFLHEHDIVSFDDIKILDDTWIMAFMIYNKGFGISNSLEALTEKYFGISWKNAVKDYLDNFTRNIDKHYGNLPTKILGKYAGQDAYYNLKVYQKLKQDLPEGCDYITEILTKSILVFAEAELKGIKVDWDMYEFLKTSYETTCAEHMEKMNNISIVQKFKEKVGDFNPGSPDQLRDILFDKKYFDLPSIKVKRFMTDKKLKPTHPKNKQSTDKNVIPFLMEWLDECDSGVFQERCQNLMHSDGKMTREDQYCFNHVIKKDPDDLDSKYTECRTFLDHYKAWKRIGGKLLPTYINPVKERSPNDLYRPDFKINGTNTGRVSSGFHTMDQGSEITRMYTSRWRDSGGLILAPDYSQIEVRIVAALAGETALIEAYTKGYDIHKQTAAKAYGISLDEVTHDQRQHGKVLNFFTIYGGGPPTLSNELNISLEAATKMLDNFFIGYPKLKVWADKQKEILKRDGFITTIWGRKIPIPDVHSDNTMFVEHALRAATNYPVQSAASDCVTYSLVRIHEEFKKNNLRSLIIASVHDSIEVDVYPGEVFKVVKIFKDICEEEVQRMHPWITCPLKISFEIGPSWGGAIEYEIDEMTDNKLSLTGSGLRKDFLLTKSVAERSYSAEISVIQIKELNDADFGSEYYFRDTENWDAKLVLEGNGA